MNTRSAAHLGTALGLACLLTACGGVGPNQDQMQTAFQQGLQQARGKNPGSDSYLPPDVIANIASRMQLQGCKSDLAWEAEPDRHVVCEVHVDLAGLRPNGGAGRDTLHFEKTDDGWRMTDDANNF